MSAKASAVLLFLIWASQLAAASTLIRGASPDNTDKYTPKDGKFTCFDGSLTIDFSQVRGVPACLSQLYRPVHLTAWCACRSMTTSAIALTAATNQVCHEACFAAEASVVVI